MPSFAEHMMHFKHLWICDARETTPHVLRLAAIFQFKTCLRGHRKFKIAQNARSQVTIMGIYNNYYGVPNILTYIKDRRGVARTSCSLAAGSNPAGQRRERGGLGAENAQDRHM